MQVDPRTFEDGDLTIHRQMICELADDEHGQHRGTRDAFLDRPDRELADRDAFLILAHILVAYIALHVELRRPYFQHFGDLILQPRQPCDLFLWLDNNLLPAEVGRKGCSPRVLFYFKLNTGAIMLFDGGLLNLDLRNRLCGNVKGQLVGGCLDELETFTPGAEHHLLQQRYLMLKV